MVASPAFPVSDRHPVNEFVWFVYCLFEDRGPYSSPGWPEPHFVVEDGLKLLEL